MLLVSEWFSVIPVLCLFTRCDVGYTGSDCSEPDCSSLSNCSSHGTCIEPNLCECETGYSGSTCQDTSCELLNRCSGNKIFQKSFFLFQNV